jgi:hypothetical protein
VLVTTALVLAAGLVLVVPTGPASAATAAPGCGPDPLEATFLEAWTEWTGGVQVGIEVLEVGTGCRFGAAADALFRTASVVKLQVLAAVLLRLQQQGDRVDGELDALLYDMIAYSDNEATNLLVEWLGGLGELQAAADRFGMTNTDNAWEADWGQTLTTASDMNTLMAELLVRGGPLNDASRALARGYLGQVEGDQRWGVGAIQGHQLDVLVKNGWWDNADSTNGPTSGWRLNSVGLIELPNGRAWAISILGNAWQSESDERFIGELAQHIADVVVAPRSIAIAEMPAALPVRAALSSVAPTRLLDTRSSRRPLLAGATVKVAIPPTAAGIVPVAVAVNVTAVTPPDGGFVTVFPSDVPRPETSNLNVTSGRTTANLAVTSVASDGTISVYTFGATHLIVDLVGEWLPVEGAVSAGRFRPVTPVRVADSRNGRGPLPANGSLRVAVAGADSRSGVPATATAVAVSVTVTGATNDGFWTVWGAGNRPNTSNVNVLRRDTLANTSIVTPDENGFIQVYGQSGGHVIVDVVGWFTGAEEPAGTDGLLAPLATPVRVADSRAAVGLSRLSNLIATVGVGAGSGVVGNLTWLYSRQPGFVTVWPAGEVEPNTSVANPDPAIGYAFANALLMGSGSGGQIALAASAPVDILIDVAAVFT